MLGQIITWLALIFLILGAADYILGINLVLVKSLNGELW